MRDDVTKGAPSNVCLLISRQGSSSMFLPPAKPPISIRDYPENEEARARLARSHNFALRVQEIEQNVPSIGGLSTTEIHQISEYLQGCKITINFELENVVDVFDVPRLRNRMELHNATPQRDSIERSLFFARSPYLVGTYQAIAQLFGVVDIPPEARVRRDINHYMLQSSPGFIPSTRPIFGALNYGKQPGGAAPFFGASYVTLRPYAAHNATFGPGDSYIVGRSAIGSYYNLRPVIAKLEPNALAYLRAVIAKKPLPAIPNEPHAYIEAQIHATVDIRYLVEEIVIDRNEYAFLRYGKKRDELQSHFEQLSIELLKRYGVRLVRARDAFRDNLKHMPPDTPW